MTTAQVSKPRKNYIPRAIRPQSVSIAPQALNLKVTGKDLPKYWYANNPLLTHFWNVFTSSFPPGERWMIDVVRMYRDQVKDNAVLNKEIAGFIGQEAHHAREHETLNLSLEVHGLPMKEIDNVARWAIDTIRKLPKHHQLAIVGGAEHLTALFGEMALNHPELIELAPADIQPLLIWHSMEEIEHKAVTYDLYEAVDGNYLRRVFGYTLLTSMFFSFTGLGILHMSIKDRTIFKMRSNAKALWWMFGTGRKAGYFRKALPALLEYYSPDYHPWNHDNSELLALWKPKLQRMMLQNASGESSVQ